jgi:hypothetical protein
VWRNTVPPHSKHKKKEKLKKKVVYKILIWYNKQMQKFSVKIWAYSHYASFEVEAEDSPKSIENSILDKIGEKSINWEYLGNAYSTKTNRITYEEVIDGIRPVQTEKVLGVEVATGV